MESIVDTTFLPFCFINTSAKFNLLSPTITLDEEEHTCMDRPHQRYAGHDACDELRSDAPRPALNRSTRWFNG